LAFKVRGADTDQAIAVLEDTVQPGYGAPHFHLHENETFYVVAGEFTFTMGECTVPKGQLHTFQNVGTTPGRLLAVVWPAVAFEGFVAEVGTSGPPSVPPDLEKLLAAAEKYGVAVPPPEPGGA